MLLHNGNKSACVSLGYFVIVKEYYLRVKTVLHKLRYCEHIWAIYVDFKMVNFLLGQQRGSPNVIVFSVTGTVALLISTG